MYTYITMHVLLCQDPILKRAIWFAYIMTRPLGASFADWFGKPYLDGLGLGDTKVALVLTILIIGFVGYLTVTRKDIKGEQR